MADAVVNACDSSPCQNGGTCSVDDDDADGYSCACESEFTGDRCQQRK